MKITPLNLDANHIKELTDLFMALDDVLLPKGLDVDGKAPNFVDIIFPSNKYLEPEEFENFMKSLIKDLKLTYSFDLIVSFYQGKNKKYEIILEKNKNHYIS